VVLGFTSAPANAAGYIKSVQTRYGSSPVVHYLVRYEVYDGGYSCRKDQYGLYDDPDCMNYDSNDATMSIRVVQKVSGGSRQVYQESVYGLDGKARVDLYGFQLNAPLYARSGTRRNYRAIFTLYDPVNDRAVESVTRDFQVTWR
jgi:hypothetical protein